MAGERTLPGLGLTGFWDLGSSWKTGMDANLRLLSAAVALSPASATTALPGSPTDGMVYIVPASDGTNPNKVAVRDNGAWIYLTPAEGWCAWIRDTDRLVIYNGTAWVEPPSGATMLSALTDVDLDGLADGNILQWDAGESKWMPVAYPASSSGLPTYGPAQAGFFLKVASDGLSATWAAPPSALALTLDDLTDVATAGAAIGYVLKYDGTGWVAAAESGGGSSLPTGGTEGQLLAKASGDDGDVEWVDPPEGGGGGIADAPSDGTLYARKDAGWTEIPPIVVLTQSEYDALSPPDAGTLYLIPE